MVANHIGNYVGWSQLQLPPELKLLNFVLARCMASLKKSHFYTNLDYIIMIMQEPSVIIKFYLFV